MTPILIFSIGVATSAFITGVWHAVQSAAETDANRWRHLAIVVLVVLILAGLGLGAPERPMRLVGAALIAASLWLGLAERGRSSGLCLIQAAFGLSVAAGLPYAID